MVSRLLVVAALPLVLSCSRGEDTHGSEVTQESLPRSEEVVSLLGVRLVPVALPGEVRDSYETQLARARQELDEDPESLDAIIWVGRRLAYLGRYREAIDAFTAGLVRYPREPRLYRHRGHRFITTRQLEAAIADFDIAASLVSGTADRIEADGLPNARGIPTSTLQSNIWYHLGLAHYLRGDFRQALEAYEECLQVSGNPDMLVATSHWLYMTLCRLGREADALEILAPISPEMDIIENQEYHQLLLLYRGEVPLESLVSTSNDSGSAALQYGIGNWHLCNGRQEKAEEVFAAILRKDQWAAFGYLAAEAEIARPAAKTSR